MGQSQVKLKWEVHGCVKVDETCLYFKAVNSTSHDGDVEAVIDSLSGVSGVDLELLFHSPGGMQSGGCSWGTEPTQFEATADLPESEGFFFVHFKTDQSFGQQEVEYVEPALFAPQLHLTNLRLTPGYVAEKADRVLSNGKNFNSELMLMRRVGPDSLEFNEISANERLSAEIFSLNDRKKKIGSVIFAVSRKPALSISGVISLGAPAGTMFDIQIYENGDMRDFQSTINSIGQSYKLRLQLMTERDNIDSFELDTSAHEDIDQFDLSGRMVVIKNIKSSEQMLGVIGNLKGKIHLLASKKRYH